MNTRELATKLFEAEVNWGRYNTESAIIKAKIKDDIEAARVQLQKEKEEAGDRFDAACYKAFEKIKPELTKLAKECGLDEPV